MARYEHLPIYREAFALCVFFENLVLGMARYEKYTQEERIETLREIRSKVEGLKVVLRLAGGTKEAPPGVEASD